MRPDCPYPKASDSSSSPTSKEKEKISKIAAPKATGKPGGSPKNAKGDSTLSSSQASLKESSSGTLPTSSTTSSVATEEKLKTKIVEEKPVTPEALMSDLSRLAKSLQGLTAIQLRYVEAKEAKEAKVYNNDGVKVALVDGGATHALRRGTKSELENAEKVTVELAHGSTVLKKKRGCSTLLTSEDVEPILPVRLLIDHGFNLTWTKWNRHPPSSTRSSTLLEATGVPCDAQRRSPGADEGA